ncbi:MAG: hypothetical protein R3D78_08590 [Paracoccaceae bacterium]|jgi:hypothetical protein
MKHYLSPADELAEIRTELARLKRREAELRMAYLTDVAMPRVGRWHKVELVTQRRTVFEPRLLPADIRNNPAFLRERVTRVLRSSRLPTPERLPELEPAPDPLAVLRPRPRPRFLAALAQH